MIRVLTDVTVHLDDIHSDTYTHNLNLHFRSLTFNWNIFLWNVFAGQMAATDDGPKNLNRMRQVSCLRAILEYSTIS